MKILLTGGFSGIGPLVCRELHNMGIDVHVIDEFTKARVKSARSGRKYYKKKTWGDISDNEFCMDMVAGSDCVVHMLEKIPAFGEDNEVDRRIADAGGTKALIDAIRRSNPRTKLIYISSASVNGPTQEYEPPVNAIAKLNPVSKYAACKASEEKLIVDSGMDFCILRLAEIFASPGRFPDDMLENLFDHPLVARNEAITDLDAAFAIAAAAYDSMAAGKVLSKILYIAGGKENGWQLINRELLPAVFDAMGIGMLDEECFAKDSSSYSMDWYDTAESGRLLDYKKHSFDEYIESIRAHTQKGGAAMRLMAPGLKRTMESMSPYRSLK